MALKLNSSAFGTKVAINHSGEVGIVTGFASYQRSKAKHFYVEYRGADGCAKENWFYEDQLSEI